MALVRLLKLPSVFGRTGQREGCYIYISRLKFYLSYQYFKENFSMTIPIVQARLCFLTPHKAYLLNTSVPSLPQSSGSFVLSLGEFLSSTVKLHPETVIASQQTETQGQPQENCHCLRSSQHYQEVWCDYLFDMLCEDNIMQTMDEAVMFTPAGAPYVKHIIQTGYFTELQLPKNQDNIKNFISQTLYNRQWQPVPQNKIKNVVVINMSTSVRDMDKTKPKINLNGLFSGLYYRKGDKWKSFKILNNEIPTAEQLVCADTVLLSGSSESVNTMHQYIRQAASNLMDALQLNKSLKVIGFCFGHQLIAHSHDSRVERRTQMRGLEYIHISDSCTELSYFSEMGNQDNLKLKIYEFHSDYVVQTPQGFTCFGQSQSCKTEILVSEDKRIVSFQFHPEYTIEYIRALEKRWESRDSNYTRMHQDNYDLDEEHHEGVKTIRKVIRNFIDWSPCQN